MAVFLRLAGTKMSSHIMNCERQNLLLMARTVTLKPLPVQPPSSANFDEQNTNLGRPQSPHLTIYAVQLTSMLSITHRMTGAALAGVTTLLGVGAIVSPQPLTDYIDMIQALDVPSPVLLSVKAVLAYPFAYHACNGVRHLLWDTGRFLSIKEVYVTGYIMLALSAAATGGLLCL